MRTTFTQPVLVVFVFLIVLLRQGGNAWAMVGFPFTANSNQKKFPEQRKLEIPKGCQEARVRRAGSAWCRLVMSPAGRGGLRSECFRVTPKSWTRARESPAFFFVALDVQRLQKKDTQHASTQHNNDPSRKQRHTC